MPFASLIGLLLEAAAVGLLHRPLHRAGDDVGVEDHLAVDVARRAADRLHQRGLGAQKALLVGVENRDQRAFGNVEALAQQVDADQHVEGAEPQVADDLDALDRVDVRVHVAHPHAVLVQILGEVLGHPLGQRRDQRAVAAPRDLLHLADEVVDLAARRADFDRRIDEAGRADDLLDEHARRSAPFPSRPASPRHRRSAAASRPIPRSAAAGCPCRRAGGSRIRRASPCGGSRRDTCRRSAAPSHGSRRRRPAHCRADIRTGSAAARRAAGRSDSANSSRCRRRSRSPPAFRDRTRCAARAVAPRAAAPAWLSWSSRSFSSCLIASIDCSSVGRGVT